MADARPLHRARPASRATAESGWPTIRRVFGCVAFAVLAVWLSLTGHAQPTGESLTGWLTLVWADSQPADQPEPASRPDTLVFFAGDDGVVRRVEVSPALVSQVGGLLRFDRRRVTLTMAPAGLQQAAEPPGLATGAPPVLRPVDVQLLAASDVRSRGGEQPLGLVAANVTGAQPWVTIACKFSDNSTEPKSLSYFTGMYGSTSPGLDHYWRELSYDAVTLAGSMAYGWFDLPSPRSAYVYDMDGNGSIDADLDALFTDCTAAATASVHFPAFQGINMVFNADLDGPAWGGSRYATLDGVAKVWRVTWEPPWAYADVSVIAHEMGHGFGLPHSSGTYGAIYDNAWDVMSKDRYGCPPEDAIYGCTGQHTIAYHKDLLGWIPSARKVAVAFGAPATVTLERLAQPTGTNPLMVSVSAGTPNGKYFTAEVRRRVGYDAKLPPDAVVIHEVIPGRSDDRPAHVIDIDGNGDTSDAGAMWGVGETFVDASGVHISVTAATSTGYVLSISGATTAPTLSLITPWSGSTAGGTIVVLTGGGFVEGQTTVRFGGQLSSSVTVTSATSLTATTPPGSSGTVDVVVETPNGQATLAQAFSYVAAPVISSVTPPSAPAYTSATFLLVAGNHFVNGDTTVAFVSGATPAVSTDALVSGVTSSSLTVTVPWLAPGIYSLEVTTPGGVARSSYWIFGFPTVSAITPSLGPVAGGTVITITGTEFVSGSTTVSVAGVALPPASVVVGSSTQITAVMPAGNAGYATVRVSTPAGYSERSFEYLAPPTLTGIAPVSGPVAGNTRITLNGTNLLDRASAPLTVTVGGVLATDLWYFNSTQVSVVTPPGVEGTAAVVVTTGGGSATSPSSFRYVPAPTVTAVSPARGPATTGTTLTITGTGFRAGDTTVQFAIGASPWYSASTVVVDSPTSLHATAPGSMYAAAYAILVTTPGGTATLSNAYTAVNPPQLYQVLPATGPAGVQTLITLSGWEFASGDTRVTVGGIDATDVTVTSATTLQARTPASAAGARDVVVTTVGGSATLTSGFTFVAPWPLTVATSGTGSGAVTSAPAGIACGTTCGASFAHGASVTLAAAPTTGSTFAGWSGGGCSGTGGCSVTMTGATSVTATFTLNTYQLTVSKTGTGSGTVTSIPGGIACGAACSAVLGHGATVTLTATPSTGATFTGWSGGGCSGTGTCSVTMSGAVDVTATFTTVPVVTYTLTVARAGSGTGSVESSPAGLACGPTCSATYASGTRVTLTATPTDRLDVHRVERRRLLRHGHLQRDDERCDRCDSDIHHRARRHLHLDGRQVRDWHWQRGEQSRRHRVRDRLPRDVCRRNPGDPDGDANRRLDVRRVDRCLQRHISVRRHG